MENISNFFTSSEVIKGDTINGVINNRILSSVNLVHFSGHGFFNKESPLESGLYLQGLDLAAESNQPNLTLKEIFKLPLKECNLVTLSASNTGFTDFLSFSKEYIGLPYGFLYAGSSAVVSSLWEISDLSTAILMIRFYQILIQNKNIPVALNQAQRWLRDLTVREFKRWIVEIKPILRPTIRMSLRRTMVNLPDDTCPFRDPYYWAAFCAIGQ